MRLTVQSSNVAHQQAGEPAFRRPRVAFSGGEDATTRIKTADGGNRNI
jgi:hypothetical protein